MTLNVPEGWKLVPVEPTQAMMDAWDQAETCAQAWRGALAAPQPAEKP